VLETIGELFKNIILSTILCEVSGCRLLCDEKIVSRPKHSTALQISRPVERVPRNFDAKWITGAVFIDVAMAFDTVWVDGLLYKLKILKFPS
jgi:hypothetical protein